MILKIFMISYGCFPLIPLPQLEINLFYQYNQSHNYSNNFNVLTVHSINKYSLPNYLLIFEILDLYIFISVSILLSVINFNVKLQKKSQGDH